MNNLTTQEQPERRFNSQPNDEEQNAVAAQTFVALVRYCKLTADEPIDAHLEQTDHRKKRQRLPVLR